MRRLKKCALVVLVGTLVACSAAQLEKAKKVSSITIPFFTKIALAYGAPYAEVIRVFADTANPRWNASGKYDKENYQDSREEDYDYDDEEYDDGEYDDEEYDDEEYDDGEYDDEEYDDEEYDDEEYDDESDEDYDESDDEYDDSDDEYDDSDDEYDDSDDEYDDSDADYDESDDENNDSEDRYESDEYQEEKDSFFDQEEDGKLKAKVDVVREFVKENRSIARPVRNGDILNEDDNYKVQISCNTDCYAYIAQLDSTGRMDPIFPSGFVELENPLQGSNFYSMPPGNDWFFLDASKGVEQIYFIISEKRRSDIELIFKQLSEANENLQQKSVVSLDQPLVLTKGIGGVRRSKVKQEVQFRNGRRGGYLPTVLDSIEAELVVTRWFNHQ